MTENLPLPQVVAQESALVLPGQRPPQRGCARSHRVDHLPPVQTGLAGAAEIRTERGTHLLQGVLATQSIQVRQLRRCAGVAEPTRERAVTGQQRDRGAACDQMQGHVDARESGTDHQDALEPARTESRERTRRRRSANLVQGGLGA